MKLNSNEVKIILKAINVTIEILEDELLTRTGFSKTEIENLYQDLKADAPLSQEKLENINQILNEVCYGFGIDNFELSIGEEKNHVIKLLERIQKSLL